MTSKQKLQLNHTNKFTEPYTYVGVAEDANDLEHRRYSHELEGYKGIMYYRKTMDMRKSENYQINHAKEKDYRLHNIQQKSNVSQIGGAKEGYIYAIST